jgi:hypothetical protein
MYIFIERNFMNQIFGKLNNNARIIRKLNNPHPDNREYTVPSFNRWRSVGQVALPAVIEKQTNLVQKATAVKRNTSCVVAS